MGVMIAGVYHTEDPAPDTKLDGAYRRQASTIRNALPDGVFTPIDKDTRSIYLRVTLRCTS